MGMVILCEFYPEIDKAVVFHATVIPILPSDRDKIALPQSGGAYEKIGVFDGTMCRKKPLTSYSPSLKGRGLGG
jgi:hypothetical protein